MGHLREADFKVLGLVKLGGVKLDVAKFEPAVWFIFLIKLKLTRFKNSSKIVLNF